jgi:two-component system cell cycle sensor histidine kinase/response regulator CckA
MNAGLGLDTAKGIVESVDGSIFVSNSDSTGTTISLRLPCSSVEVIASTEQEDFRVDTNQNHLVIVVDDEEAVRKYIRRCLEREGYRVISARDGQEGYELISHYEELNQPVSAVVSDMLMPRMGGPEMARKLSEAFPNLPFLFISGYTNERVPDSISADVAFLNKPFALSALSAALRRLIANRTLSAMTPEPHRR